MMSVERRCVVPVLLVASLAGNAFTTPLSAAGENASRPAPATSDVAASSLPAAGSRASDVGRISRADLERQIAAEAKRLAATTQGNSNAKNSNHECGMSAVFLGAGSVIAVASAVGDSNKDPQDPSRLKTSSAIGVALGVTIALVGAIGMAHSCGQ
jgi:hypothetical protein